LGKFHWEIVSSFDSKAPMLLSVLSDEKLRAAAHFAERPGATYYRP
jgi:hypothetical protein